MGGGGEGREGDWECGACGNRNYAFRSFCNRCKQLRLVVDTKTPADSKWLPRIGDWICSGCTNNNYASRGECKKCGQLKEIAALPAIAIPGASVQSHPHYFARTQGGPEQRLNIESFGNRAPQHSLPLNSNWYPGEGDKFGIQQTSSWPLGGNLNSRAPYMDQGNQLLMAPKGWRNGDWICNCGFHNYSSRGECKKCNASMPPALGTKRLASEDLVHDWDNKRLNAGQTHGLHNSYPAYPLPSYANGASAAAPNLPVQMQFPNVAANPTLLGKGAKQWRDGDWMCTSCNNHNYASRSNCNRCKTEKDSIAQPVGAA